MRGSAGSGPSAVIHFLFPSLCLLLERRTSLQAGRQGSASLNLSPIGQRQREQKRFRECDGARQKCQHIIMQLTDNRMGGIKRKYITAAEDVVLRAIYLASDELQLYLHAFLYIM